MDFLADYFKGKVFVAAAMWMFTVFSVTRSSRSKTSSCFYPSLYPPWVGTMSWTSLHSSIDNPLSRHPVMYFCSFWLLSPLLSLQDWLIWSVGGRLQGRLLWNLKVRQSVNVRHPDTYCVKCQYTIQAKWSYNQTIEAIAPAVCWSMRRNWASPCHAPTPSLVACDCQHLERLPSELQSHLNCDISAANSAVKSAANLASMCRLCYVMWSWISDVR